MNTDQLCGLLAEPSRLRTYSAGLPNATVGKALQKLIKAGIITASPALAADESVFKEAVRGQQTERTPLDPDPERDAVLKAFIRDGRLTHFPTYPEKLRVVLEYLATTFEPDRDYPETEVNALLNQWHSDHAALRRELVDARLLVRTNSIYRRA